MAKRYIRLNFENAPSVKTPLSATTMNRMDKGIDDIDTALDALESSVVGQFVDDPSKINNATVNYSLKQDIDTLTNNLANYFMTSIEGVDLASIQNVYDNYSNSIGADTYYRFLISHKTAYDILGGGAWYVEGLKRSAAYEWQQATSYSPTGMVVYARCKHNGVWTAWVGK